MEIVQSILTNNPCYKAGKSIAVKGLMLHSVGCSQPSAEAFIKQWNKPEQKNACVHAFIDGNSGKVYQTLPWEHRGWHAGGDANNTHIGVEMCEPANIRYTGGASFECSNADAAMETVKRTYDAAVELFAFLCHKFHLDPLADGVIISHKEGHGRGIASGHSDPTHLWDGLRSGYTMDGFRQDVLLAMARIKPLDTGTQPADTVAQSSNTGTKPEPAKEWKRMDISDKGIEFIMKFEGCRLEAYQCAAGVWTIGYGHTAGVKQGDKLPSQEAAKELFKEDIKQYSGYVNTYVEKGIIGFMPTQNQFDALTSFCYNCGSGNLKKLVSDRDAAAVAEAMLSYVMANKQVNAGLQRRREAEREMFLR